MAFPQDRARAMAPLRIERPVKGCLRGLGLMPGTLDHWERRILAESGVGFRQAAPIENAAGGGGDCGGMATGVTAADRVHRVR